MQGWNIFKHSMEMVVGNLAVAIKLALVPALIGSGLVIAAIMMIDVPVEVFADEEALEQLMLEQGPGAVTGAFIAFVPIGFILLAIELWVFVAWHRFILLEEYPTGWIPPFHGDRILAYFGKGLLLGLIAMGMAFVLIMGAAAIGAIGGQAAGIILVPFLIAGWIFIIISVYRLTPILPATAIGKPLTIIDAWAATHGTGWALLLVLIIAGVVQFLLQFVASLSMAVFAPLGFLFLLLAMLVMTLVNVSILTTLYGHYIEGRALN